MSWLHFLDVLARFDYRVVVDVLAVAWLVYRLLLLAKGTRATQIILGLLVFLGAVWLSGRWNLTALNWLLRLAFPLGPVAIVILFLPELRHALEEFGRPGFWGRSLGLVARADMSDMIAAVVSAVSTMSAHRTGALLVFERETGLDDIVATGIVLNADVSAELLGTVFQKGSPLHDGAVVVRDTVVVAAGCTLPLTASPRVEATVHTRHKAALGMSEESDAVVVVVSEETGTVSIAAGGRLLRGLGDEALRERLLEFLQVTEPGIGLGGTPLGQVATRVGDALKTARARERTNGARRDARPRRTP